MRVFDTFLFDGELCLLEHRLREVWEEVDAFVLVEAGTTYRGEPKALAFAEDRDRFGWAASKLRPIALQRLGAPGDTPRKRAAFQRGALVLALRDAEPDDVVLILDADEIPSRSFLRKLRAEGLAGPSRLSMTRHYEYADLVAPGSPCCPSTEPSSTVSVGAVHPGRWEHLGERWHGCSGVAVRFRDLTGDRVLGLAPRSPYALRFGRLDGPVLPDAGRHLSSVDPSSRLDRKLGRVFHEEFGDALSSSPSHLERCRHYGVHHRGWWYAASPAGPMPDDLQRLAGRFPEMVRPGELPPMWIRRTVRAWARLRSSSLLSASTVEKADRLLNTLRPVLALTSRVYKGTRGESPR